MLRDKVSAVSQHLSLLKEGLPQMDLTCEEFVKGAQVHASKRTQNKQLLSKSLWNSCERLFALAQLLCCFHYNVSWKHAVPTRRITYISPIYRSPCVLACSSYHAARRKNH